MPAPAERRAAIDREVAELERLCGESARSLDAQDWNAFAAALRDARRVRHALSNAVGVVDPTPDAQYEAAIARRVQAVYKRREEQLEELREHHADVAARLNVLARWKSAARASTIKRESSPSVAFDTLQ